MPNFEPKLSETRWDKQFEEPIYSSWKKSGKYNFNNRSKKSIYSIDTPPPYVNAPVHIGQVATYILMDMFARFRRMIGFEVLFPLGLDRNGIPIELAAEKRYQIKIHEMPRGDFIKKCKELLDDAGATSVNSFYRCGICFNSLDFGTRIGDAYMTDSDSYRALTQETFIDMLKRGLVYEDNRINNWCPGCRTTLADSEVIRKDVETNFNYVKFRIKESNECITVATTRPELLCTAALIVYNPKDTRYKHLKGKTAITPIFDVEVPIIEHTAADPKFGTGLVFMSKSAGDQDAVRFLREMKIEPKMAVDISGRMNENAGVLKGLKTKEARHKIIELIKENGLLEKQERLMHSVPICERSGDEIEFIMMPEFYVKQIGYKSRIKKIAKKIDFFDEDSRKMLTDWISSVSIDWPISRRRYYATEIPLWYCKECKTMVVPEKGKYYRPWAEKCPAKKCEKCGSGEFVGETRVFDTWFDSSISPLYILGYGRHTEFFKKNPICSLRPQGKDIVRTWLYYTILKDYLLTGRCIFKDVWINHHIVDETGKKMSKSVGNVITPEEILSKYGAEPLRLWCAVEGNLTKADLRCSFERIMGAGKTLTKLWNVARFISMFPKVELGNAVKGNLEKRCELDKWILHELIELVRYSGERYLVYDFHNPAVRIKHFIWEIFASHYIELVKTRAYNEKNLFKRWEQDSARATLYDCLELLMKVLAPIVPVITYKIYNELNRKDIHFEGFPMVWCEKKRIVFFKAKIKSGLTAEDIIELNSKIWQAKKERGLNLKDAVERLIVPKKFAGVVNDIKATHNISKVEYGKNIFVEF